MSWTKGIGIGTGLPAGLGLYFAEQGKLITERVIIHSSAQRTRIRHT